MNTKLATIIFLVLLVAVLSYPPFFWNSYHTSIDRSVRDQLPIKKHAMIFRPSVQKFQLKHFPKNADAKETPQASAELQERLKNYSDEELESMVGIVPLQRSLALADLAIEIVIGFAISALLGLILARKK